MLSCLRLEGRMCMQAHGSEYTHMFLFVFVIERRRPFGISTAVTVYLAYITIYREDSAVPVGFQLQLL